MRTVPRPRSLLILLACAALAAGALSIPSGRADADSATQVSVGDDFACAVTTGGAAMCWGLNDMGQLGAGTSSGPQTCVSAGSDSYPCSKVPVQVSGLASGVRAISAGTGHACALLEGGTLKCWGRADAGQLGAAGPETCTNPFGTNACSTTPVEVSGLTDVDQVSVDGAHSCALLTSGGVKCWGDNLFGYLGDGTTTNRSTPVTTVAGGAGKLATAGFGGCVLMQGGGPVRCWGDNLNGSLGNGDNTQPDTCNGRACAKTPVTVSGLGSGVAEVEAGTDFACALLMTNELKCWGYNGNGQLGNGDSEGPENCLAILGAACAMSPVHILSGVDSLGETNGAHMCVIAGGAVKCWGLNSSGELGTSHTGPDTCSSGFKCSESPIDVANLGDQAAQVASGGANTCARTSDDGIKCWGFNFYGAVGDNQTSAIFNTESPNDVSGLAGANSPTPTPPPLLIAWGNLDCDSGISAGDLATLLRALADVDGAAPGGCFAVGAAIIVENATHTTWGNMDCLSGIDAGDVLTLAYGWAGVPLPFDNSGCYDVGDTVTVAAR